MKLPVSEQCSCFCFSFAIAWPQPPAEPGDGKVPDLVIQKLPLGHVAEVWTG